MAASRILVVEDEPGMLDIIRVNLEQAGYDVVAARDGVDACQLLDGGSCDAVVLDLGLPRMSGFRFLTLLRRDQAWRQVPVIVVTAFAFEEVEEITAHRVDAFISKPFHPRELIGKLKYLLPGRARVLVA